MKNFVLPVFLAACFISPTLSQCCLKFQDNKCISCPQGMHLFRDNCIYDVSHCSTYKDGFDCQNCENGYQLSSTGQCEEIPPPEPEKNYTDRVLDLRNLEGQDRDYFQLSNELFLTLEFRAGSAEPQAALLRRFKNGTNHMIIEWIFRDEFYRGVLDINLLTSISTIVSFEKVEQLSIMKQNEDKENGGQSKEEIDQKIENNQTEKEKNGDNGQTQKVDDLIEQNNNTSSDSEETQNMTEAADNSTDINEGSESNQNITAEVQNQTVIDSTNQTQNTVAENSTTTSESENQTSNDNKQQQNSNEEVAEIEVLPERILTNNQGRTRLKKEQFEEERFQKMSGYIMRRKILLAGSTLVGAYSETKSSTTVYYLYYKSDFSEQFFEAVVVSIPSSSIPYILNVGEV